MSKIKFGNIPDKWVEKTSDYTAKAWDCLIADTTTNVVNVTLPAATTIGQVVKIADKNDNFAVNNLNILRNGKNINSTAADKKCVTNGAFIELIYTDDTVGWLSSVSLSNL